MAASSWQKWLSPRPNRSNIAADASILAAHDSTLFEFIQGSQGQLVVRETHRHDNLIVRAGLSGPVLHIHGKQDEFFRVEQGQLDVCRNGKWLRLDSTSGVVKVPAGTRHRFKAIPSGDQDVIFQVWAQPQGLDNSFDENFIRNLIGYQRDCQLANMRPSVFQLILICYDAGTIASPPFWVPFWLLCAVQHVLGYYVGGILLGYKPSYGEYSKESALNKYK